MGAWRVILSEPAEADLERVVAFLARTNLVAAERIGLEIVQRIFTLDTLPARGAPLKGRPGLRKTVLRHYLIIDRLHDATRVVEIVRVWDGRINPAEFSLP
ncbi:MAG: type II toxin-antitoxin system RelE/ParE family toxin [Opitutaceae bacterium]